NLIEEIEIKTERTEPEDWKPQDKCNFCVDGKLLKQQYQQLLPKNLEALLKQVGVNPNMTSLESMAAQFAALQRLQTVPELNPFYHANLFYQQFQQHSPTGADRTASPSNRITPNSSNDLSTPSTNNSTPTVGTSTGEQPLDLSAKPSGPCSSVLDSKHIFKAKPRISTVPGRRSYTEEELNNALQDILSGKLGTRRAAVLYGIPRSTLRNKVYKLALEQKQTCSSLELNDGTDDSQVILKVPSVKSLYGSSSGHNKNGDTTTSNSTPSTSPQISSVASVLSNTSPQPNHLSLRSPAAMLQRQRSESQSPPFSINDVIRNSIRENFKIDKHSTPLMIDPMDHYGKRPSISVIKNLGGTDISRFGSNPNISQMNQHNQMGPLSPNTGTGGKGTRPKRGKYRNYDRDSLVEAVKAVQRGEMSVHRAGSYYGVPHSTLEYKVKERHLMRPRKREPKPQPTDDRTGAGPSAKSQEMGGGGAINGSGNGGGGGGGNGNGSGQSNVGGIGLGVGGVGGVGEEGGGADSFNSVTCFCGKPFAGRPMIECSGCLTWLHMSCAKVKRKNIPEFYFCEKCKATGTATNSSGEEGSGSIVGGGSGGGSGGGGGGGGVGGVGGGAENNSTSSNNTNISLNNNLSTKMINTNPMDLSQLQMVNVKPRKQSKLMSKKSTTTNNNNSSNNNNRMMNSSDNIKNINASDNKFVNKKSSPMNGKLKKIRKMSPTKKFRQQLTTTNTTSSTTSPSTKALMMNNTATASSLMAQVQLIDTPSTKESTNMLLKSPTNNNNNNNNNIYNTAAIETSVSATTTTTTTPQTNTQLITTPTPPATTANNVIENTTNGQDGQEKYNSNKRLKVL
ncbi:unnamed protein product, partial [Diamesa serratosioi]